jgi:hypothetical protein
MGENLKLLVWAARKAQAKKAVAGVRFDRRKLLAALSGVGARVRHDSGGRLIVIELPQAAEPELLKRLPGAKLLPPNAEMKDSLADPDPTEALFLQALTIRSSASYRAAKSNRRFGESPEEKLLRTGSCVRGY